VRGKLVFSTPKLHERRSVPFPAFLADELATLMVGRGRDDVVFTSSDGTLLRVSHWRPRVLGPAVAQLAQAVRWFPGTVLTLDTYADLFPDDLELVSAALDRARPVLGRGGGI
jgi:hypothetical protein